MASPADLAKMRSACTVFLQVGAQDEVRQLQEKVAQQAREIERLQNAVWAQALLIKNLDLQILLLCEGYNPAATVLPPSPQ